jgi:hypothetical protein
MFPTRGAVTSAVLADPAYTVMSDLLFRKTVAQYGFNLGEVAARYTMTVDEAAVALRLPASDVRWAIEEKRLASWVKNGNDFIDPRSLKSYELVSSLAREKALRRQLDIVLGHKKGATLKVRAAVPLTRVVRIAGNVLAARLEDWDRVVVLTTGSGGSRRAFVLERGDLEAEIEHGPFHVRGRFVIVDRANGGPRVDSLWKTSVVS